ncbi:hypothetical protein [Gemmatimonas groenlandica]|uniref:Uncharacterized protein n=1 Tax=Gemmatimonas groenlandica TaxID=2732249 RepID=A0A6M4IZD0_9BACT|nr:hypothetical protein [Gemmatimonas groenlandica]QJR37581.1 hypothetical protein HKW67_19705 [Gemmatimonas groenlandica]
MELPDKLDERRLVRVTGTLPLTHHVSDQEQLNHHLVRATLAPMVDGYAQLLEFSGFQALVRFPGPTRPLRGDAPEPFQSWEWSGNDFVRLFFGVGGELPRLIGVSTFEGAEGVEIDTHPFQLLRGYDASRRWFVARLDGYLRDTVELEVFIVAPTAERRDQLVAGVATLRVVASPNEHS